MRLTKSEVDVMGLGEMRKTLYDVAEFQQDLENLVDDVRKYRKDSKAEGYDWVVKCPYRMCGSSEIKTVSKLPGAVIYVCGECNHLFKVLQEGDVYFFDVGKEEWVSADMSITPSYFKERT